MKNAYTNALDTIDARDFSAANKKKLAKLKLIASKRAVYDALKSNDVDAKRFASRALYATEKALCFVNAMTAETIDASAFNANATATMKTALLALKAAKHVSKDDIRAALHSDIKVSEERAAYIYRRTALLSDATLNAQSQQCIDMLQTLNVVKIETKDTFSVVESDFMNAVDVALKDVNAK